MSKRFLISLCAFLGFSFGVGQAVAQQEFVVATNGAKYENELNVWIVPEFEKANNVKVVYTQGLSAAILAKVQSQRNAPQIDIAILDELPFFQGLALGVWEPVKPEEIGSRPSIVPMAFSGNGYGTAITLGGTGIYYNTKIFKENGWAPPTSWGDLLRPEFKGKAVAQTIANTHGLNLFIAANLLGGGSFPSNVEPGFDFLKKLGPALLTWDQYGETPQLLQQGASAIGTWSRENTLVAAKSGVPVEFVVPKEGVIGYRIMATAVRGRPATNVALSKKFLAMLLSERAQRQLSDNWGAFPVDRNIGGSAEQLEKMVFLPPEVIVANRAAWADRWNRMVAGR